MSGFRCLIVIPARFASTRFPGKPLHLIAGRPLVHHVWDRCRASRKAAGVVIATDDERIAATARDFGAEVALTRDDHPSGTDRLADGLARLSEFAAPHGINVIVENHGGLSSNGAWLAAVITKVGLPNCGTLPDFGNFQIGPDEEYDRYLGVRELMPFAKAVSAKSHEFDANGNEVRTDYRRMMQIVLDAEYHGYVGIEWEGDSPGEAEGVRLTQRLLERVRDELARQS